MCTLECSYLVCLAVALPFPLLCLCPIDRYLYRMNTYELNKTTLTVKRNLSLLQSDIHCIKMIHIWTQIR